MSWLERKSAPLRMMSPLDRVNAALWVPVQDGSGNPAVLGWLKTITTYNGSPAWGVGDIGRCLTFDAAAATKQYWVTSAVRGASDFGLYLLCKPVASAAANMHIVDIYPQTNSKFALLVTNANGLASASLYDSTGASVTATGTRDVRGRWALFGLSVSQTNRTISLYADGEYLTSAATPSALATNNAAINVFRHVTSGLYFNGSASHVFMATRQITEAEFRAVAQRMGVA